VETKEAEFKLFKSEFLKWAEAFGCRDWEVQFLHEGEEDLDAAIHPNVEGRAVIVELNKDVSRGGTQGIKLLAFHEAAELFLVSLRDIAQNRSFSQKSLNTEVHKVINVLERLLFA
jgi:hypothetical protein